MIAIVTGIFRLVLTAGLLYGAYTETGPWTTTALVLIFVYTEVNSMLWRRKQ